MAPMSATLAQLLGGLVVVEIVLGLAIRRLDRRGHSLGGPLRALRNLVVPMLFALLFLRLELGRPVAPPPGQEAVPDNLVRAVETLFWIAVIHFGLGLVDALLFARARADTWRARVPKLFVDLSRFFLVVIAAAFVLSAVWKLDLGDLLTTLGVGSIVLGLALQDTLGNLMAGIALLFERPYSVGDWIRVGDRTGRVVEMNWRAVRLQTRENDIIVVPNSHLGNQVISNLTTPTRVHAERPTFGFSYSDPPNKVKAVLKRAALATQGVLDTPEPKARTLGYGDSQIDYEVKLYLEDHDALPDILDEFTTRVWYAAKRNGLTIPFPIRTVYKTEMPPATEPPAPPDLAQVLAAVPLFGPLDADELTELSRGCRSSHYGHGERLVRQGEAGDSLFVIAEGSAVVAVRDEGGRQREVARLSEGDFFGEMSLLTGAPRSATVSALEDLRVVVLPSRGLKPLLERRPDLARQIAEMVETRQAHMDETLAAAQQPAEESTAPKNDRVERMLKKIRHFLGV